MHSEFHHGMWRISSWRTYGFRSDTGMQRLGGVDWTLLLESVRERRWPKEENGDHGFLVALSVDGLCLENGLGRRLTFGSRLANGAIATCQRPLT